MLLVAAVVSSAAENSFPTSAPCCSLSRQNPLYPLENAISVNPVPHEMIESPAAKPNADAVIIPINVNINKIFFIMFLL